MKPTTSFANDNISEFIDVDKKSLFFVNYFEKYALYLSNKSFNYFTKDVISHKF